VSESLKKSVLAMYKALLYTKGHSSISALPLFTGLMNKFIVHN